MTPSTPNRPQWPAPPYSAPQRFLLGLATKLDRLRQRQSLPESLRGRIEKTEKFLVYLAGGPPDIDPKPITGAAFARAVRRWVLHYGHPPASRKLAVQ